MAIGRFIDSRRAKGKTPGSFAAQLNEAERLLSRIGLFAERNYAPGYNHLRAADFRDLSYINVWTKCYTNRYFDFRLSDDSLVQFRLTDGAAEVSYAYYECPYFPLVSYEQYMEEEETLQPDDLDEFDPLRRYQLQTANVKDTITPLRYDYAPQLYKEGLHPASHMHFGHKNHIRVATKHLLKPLSFVLFLVRQCYPDHWQVITKLQDATILCRNISSNLASIEGSYWRPLDNWEMMLA